MSRNNIAKLDIAIGITLLMIISVLIYRSISRVKPTIKSIEVKEFVVKLKSELEHMENAKSTSGEQGFEIDNIDLEINCVVTQSPTQNNEYRIITIESANDINPNTIQKLTLHLSNLKPKATSEEQSPSPTTKPDASPDVVTP